MKKNIVCLGGGIGTVNLIKGLKSRTKDVAVVLSMADEGGSSGRLRRLYNIFPPGDLVSCMAAFADGNLKLKDVLNYRFPGNRYGKDCQLGGHKLGNLIMVAMRDVTGNFEEAIALFQKVFHIPGIFIPATSDPVSIFARTVDNKIVVGEENIDLGRYSGRKALDRVFIEPKGVKANPKALERLNSADIIIAGPGDLYTTILPVLIIPQISEALKRSKARKIFVVNIANKPFETQNYSVSDYIRAVEKHLGVFPFDIALTNTNRAHIIPKEFHYAYVLPDHAQEYAGNKVKIIKADLVSSEFPLYHSSEKLAKVLWKNL